MDPVITAVYVEMVRTRGASVDDILVEPELRQEFLSNSRVLLGTDVNESVLLRRLHNLRKQSKLPRSGDIQAARLTMLSPATSVRHGSRAVASVS